MTENELPQAGGQKIESYPNSQGSNGSVKRTADQRGDLGDEPSVSVEAFLRMVDVHLMKTLPGAKLSDIEFMEDIFSLFIKNIQARKSMEIRFAEHTTFEDVPEVESPRSSGRDISSQPIQAAEPRKIQQKADDDIEFDPPVQKSSASNSIPLRKEMKQQGTAKQTAEPMIAQPIRVEMDPRIVFYQATDLPANYIPMVASSLPEQMVSGKHYMIPAILDNLELFLYGACATCNQADCKNCQKLKNPHNGVRAELRMFLLCNQEVTVVGFNKSVFEGLKIEPAVLIPMIKQNRDQTAAQLLALYLGHIVLFDKQFRGKPLEEKEVTNQFYPLAAEALAPYHKKMQM